eukprot:3912256-Prymnesium_polylepis.1
MHSERPVEIFVHVPRRVTRMMSVSDAPMARCGHTVRLKGGTRALPGPGVPLILLSTWCATSV